VFIPNCCIPIPSINKVGGNRHVCTPLFISPCLQKKIGRARHVPTLYFYIP
jgi:hypothetical protein